MAGLTIRDVAALAGVSPATVSRVFNGDPRVAAELRNRVIEAGQRLGYQPNGLARSMRTQATKVLGLIISDIQNPFFTALVRGVEDAASERDYSVVLANADEDLDKERRYLHVIAAERMAGVILSPASTKHTKVDLLADRGIPVVVIDRKIRSATDIDSVTVDNKRAAQHAVAHLLDAGCRRIGVIAGRSDISTAADRLAGYRAALRVAGLPVDPSLIAHGDFRVDGGRRAALQLLGRETPPDALFVTNNLMMVGALDALAATGLSFPDDILLAGFDEMSWAGMAPPLTLVEQPTYEIGRRAAELLLLRIGGAESPAQRLVLPSALVVRRSSRP